MWLNMNHEMVKVGRVTLTPQRKVRNQPVYGDEKRAQRAMKKKEKRAAVKLEMALARGIVPFSGCVINEPDSKYQPEVAQTLMFVCCLFHY